jgi:hypothetical protein
MIDAVLGFRVHTGWAAAVAVAGSPSEIQVVDRRRFTLVEQGDHDTVFVYHAAAELDAAAAERRVATARATARANTLRELGRLLADLEVAGYSVRAVGLPGGGARPLPSLGDILRSHSLIHRAEGELYREVLADACAARGLRVIGMPSKELHPRAAAASGLGADGVKRRLTGIGRALGPPWTVDQKEATLAALIAGAEAARQEAP